MRFEGLEIMAKSAVRNPRRTRRFDYDVCLSFAGEDRSYVHKVADAVREHGVRVFFDEYEQVGMWGKDLYTHLDDVYQHLARYCVLFISKHYADRVWTTHERRSAQARALRENREYILPAKFDDTDLAGLPSTIAYISLRKITPAKFAEMILQKIRFSRDEPRQEYWPQNLDKLFEALGARTEQRREEIFGQAYWFFQALRRMEADERRAVLTVFVNTCPEELPENVHMSVDLLRRITGFSVDRLKRVLSGISSLGFHAQFGRHNGEDADEIVRLDFFSLSTESGGPATDVAERAVDIAREGYCEEHAMETLMRLDFSNLSSATFRKEKSHRPRKVRADKEPG